MSINDYRLSAKLICIIGSPASGKTYLAEKLAKALDARIIYEQPSDGFPDQIKQSLGNQSNLFETILWFRNLQIHNYMLARLAASAGETIVMDSSFYLNQLFVDFYIEDEFRRSLLREMGRIDFSILDQPDCTVYITSTTETARDFLQRRSGAREWENARWVNFITNMPPFVDQFVRSIRDRVPNLVQIERSEYDFAQDTDLRNLIRLINSST